MENRIPIYNRINLIVDKKELEYMLEVVQLDMERLEENMEHDMLEGEEKELKMIQDLYSKYEGRDDYVDETIREDDVPLEGEKIQDEGLKQLFEPADRSNKNKEEDKPCNSSHSLSVRDKTSLSFNSKNLVYSSSSMSST